MKFFCVRPLELYLVFLLPAIFQPFAAEADNLPTPSKIISTLLQTKLLNKLSLLKSYPPELIPFTKSVSTSTPNRILTSSGSKLSMPSDKRFEVHRFRRTALRSQSESVTNNYLKMLMAPFLLITAVSFIIGCIRWKFCKDSVPIQSCFHRIRKLKKDVSQWHNTRRLPASWPQPPEEPVYSLESKVREHKYEEVILEEGEPTSKSQPTEYNHLGNVHSPIRKTGSCQAYHHVTLTKPLSNSSSRRAKTVEAYAIVVPPGSEYDVSSVATDTMHRMVIIGEVYDRLNKQENVLCGTQDLSETPQL